LLLARAIALRDFYELDSMIPGWMSREATHFVVHRSPCAEKYRDRLLLPSVSGLVVDRAKTGAPPRKDIVVRAYKLDLLSDGELLRALAKLAAQERTTTAELVAHIAEVDVRRLFFRLGIDRCTSIAFRN
jgi:hypothetical protein